MNSQDEEISSTSTRRSTLSSRIRWLEGRLTGPNGQTLAASLLSQALILVTGVIAARSLGVEGRGDLALLWVAPLALVLFGSIGLPQATAYYVAQARSRPEEQGVIRTATRLAALVSVPLILLYLAAVLVYTEDKPDIRDPALISLLFVPFILFQVLGVACLQGMRAFRSYNLTRVAPVAIYATSASVAFLFGAVTLEGLVLLFVISFILANTMTWMIILKKMRGLTGGPFPAKKIVSFGLRGFFGDSNPVEDTRLDQLTVGLLVDPRGLGLYASATSFSNLPRFIAMSFGAVVFPRIAAAPDQQEQWRLAQRALILGGSITAIAVALLEAIFPFLISFFFGEAFLGAVPIGRILLLGFGFLAIKRLLTDISRGLGKPSYGSLAELTNFVFFVGSIILLAGLEQLTTQHIAASVLLGGITGCLTLVTLILRYRNVSLRASCP